MSENYVRPPFILAIMADQQGCGHHRISIPLASLVEAGVADGRIDMAAWPDHVLEAAAPDVIVFQRQIEVQMIEIMERWRKMLPNTLFVYELDDYLGEIPKASYHAGFMPPNVEKNLARALAVCDRTTTTTEPMAEWLRSLGAKDVRIIPNALPGKKLHERQPRQSGKLRVGFAGGLSHGGDLRLIEPAMEAIGTEVEWVFLGTRPEGAKDVPIEYHDGVPFMQYLDTMAKLDVDLFLAPLEDNMFNRCKSNLRLVESGAVGACVIAQDTETYRVNNPPVFAYASTPESWTEAIRSFMKSTIAERRKKADSLRSWVGRHYILERLLKARMTAWLPDGEHWRPRSILERKEKFVVTSMEHQDSIIERMPFLRRAKFYGQGLEEACKAAVHIGADVLWLRPATSMSERAWDKIYATLKLSQDIASVISFSSDGPNAFPDVDKWSAMSPTNVACLDDIVAKRLAGRRLSVPTSSGPCVVLSADALGMLGIPDVQGNGSEEQAIFEWGLRASMREWKHMQEADTFVASLAPPAQINQAHQTRLQARGSATRLQVPFEALTASERESIELELLSQNWGGPRPGSLGFGTDYKTWKALTKAQREATEEPRPWKNGPRPIVSVVQFGGAPKPFGWLVHVDDTVNLDDGALEAVMDAVQEAVNTPGSDIQVVYFDHESKFPDGSLSPELKPDFDLELFLATDYVTPICAVRVNTPFADRNELFTHVFNVALTDGAKAFHHVPRTIGNAVIETRPEELAIDALQRQIVIQDYLGDNGMVSPSKRILGCLTVVRDWKNLESEAPLVSIVIPTLGSGRLIQPCVNTIRQHTDYPNYEIIVVQNGLLQEPELGSAAEDPRIKVVRWDGEFNWSAINNWAIREHAKGDYIVTMNDDVCICVKPWLDAMMGQALVPDVGVVGAKLMHPSGFIQHVGVVAHNGIAGHIHKGAAANIPGHLGRAVLTHEASAATGACMLFHRAVFDQIDGFDEVLDRNYNDTDFCLRVREQGYRIVIEMTAEMLHPEGASRGDTMSPENLKRMAVENRMFAQKHSKPDPYWNPNLSLGLVHGGVFIAGLNMEVLAWNDFKVGKGQSRILVINDKPGLDGIGLDIISSGAILMGADLSGFKLRLIGPVSRNIAPWDVRDSARITESLRTMGVTNIILRSLIGAEGAAPPVETLRCIHNIYDVAVQIKPIEDWMVRPVTGEDEANQRVFGSVDRDAWLQAVSIYLPYESAVA